MGILTMWGAFIRNAIYGFYNWIKLHNNIPPNTDKGFKRSSGKVTLDHEVDYI